MVNRKKSVLVVDDEPMVCDLLYDGLSARGYQCATALDGDHALANLSKQDFDVVLLDIKLPGMSGMEILREIRLNHSNIATIMITAVNDVDTAVRAMKLGASDYIVKPFDLDRVDTSIRTASESKQGTKKPPAEMDAIACGVQAKLDHFSAYPKVMTERTIEVARQLGIPEEEIREWAAAKARLHYRKNKLIKSLLSKLEQSPLAQYVLGLTELHFYTPKSRESQN